MKADEYSKRLLTVGPTPLVHTLGWHGELFNREVRRTAYCVGSMSCVNESVLIARSMGVSGGNKLGVRKFESKLKTRVGA